MIRRSALSLVRSLAASYPIVTVTGPRQAGKTTLCRQAFATKPYVSLEALDTRDEVRSDPRAFLARYADGGIFDRCKTSPSF